MAFGVKRKREKDTQQRKIRKVSSDAENEFENDVSDDALSGEDHSQGLSEQDDEEWGGISTQQEVQEAGNADSRPKKPPTGEELRVIKDATELFRSSSFKLQIDALLPNVRPKSSRIPPLERFLMNLHTFLMLLPSIPPRHPLEAGQSLKAKGISVPYILPLPAEDTNWKVAFDRPNEIILVGSWANKHSVKAKDGLPFNVDIAVEMPDHLFQEKDYMNGRFFQKRAYYLAVIASCIKDAREFDVDVSYDTSSTDPRLARLVISSPKDNSTKDFSKLNAQIYIFPTLPPTSSIPLHRLSPSHSNLRISTQSTPDTPVNAPTPLYNSALLITTTPKVHLLSTHSLIQETPAFRDAVTLLRIWANQRGYGEGKRACVRGFQGKGGFWAAVLAAVIIGEEPSPGEKSSRRKPMGRGLSSYQLFKASVDLLAKHNFATDALYLRTPGGHRYPPEEYQTHHNAIFVDSSSSVNFLVDVPLGSLDLLRYDAQKTLERLDHSPISVDPFTDVFIKDQQDLLTRFDTILRVQLSSLKPCIESSTLDHGSAFNALMSSMDALLRQGLGNRVKAVAILHPSSLPRPLSQEHSSQPSTIHIGLIYNPQHVFRLVDHGPAADEPDPTVSQQFQDFWGSKADLRRFKDGRITHSVVWDIKTADERAQVPCMIVRYIIQRHFGIQEDSIITWQKAFDSMLRLPESVSSIYQTSGMPAGFRSAIGAFDGLVKAIKALDEELPLAVMNISASSSCLRYTSVFTPVPLSPSVAPLLPAGAQYLPPMEIIIEFEKSTRWPDDIRAVQKIKLAFFERVGHALMAGVDGLRAHVVTGDGVDDSEIRDNARLEIITPEGWAFAARIWHERESTLLDRIIESNKVMSHIAVKNKNGEKRDGKEHREAVEAKEVYMRRFIHAPRHHRVIASLCHRYTAFGGTVRLVKRWLAAHWLLGGHITEEAIEIICASIFIGDGRDITEEDELTVDRPGVPGSKERGFALVVEFLKDWKWEEGLFVPLYGGKANEKASSSSTQAQATDAAKPEQPKVTIVAGSQKGVWTISTEADRQGQIWTSQGPDAIVARRVRALAKATWTCMQSMEHGSLDVKSLFTHPTEDYDFIIKLDPSVLPRYAQNVSPDPKVLSARNGGYSNISSGSEATGDKLPLRPGFDPAQMFFNDLTYIYSDTFKLFYDPYGGDTFGGVWDPSLRAPRPFRVLGGYSTVPANLEDKDKQANERGGKGTSKAKDKDKMVVLNETAVLSEIERIGRGIVKEIIVQVPDDG